MTVAAGSAAGLADATGSANGGVTGLAIPTGVVTGIETIPCPAETGFPNAAGGTATVETTTADAAVGIGEGVGTTGAAIGAAGVVAGLTRVGAGGSAGKSVVCSASDRTSGNSGVFSRAVTGWSVTFGDAISSVVAGTMGWAAGFAGCDGAVIAVAVAAAAFVTGWAVGVGGTATGVIELRPMEGFSPADALVSIPVKIGRAVAVDCAPSATGVAMSVTAWPMGTVNCDGAATAAVDTPDTAAGAIGETRLTVIDGSMTGARGSFAVVEAATGADFTTISLALRHPPVSGAGMVFAPVFVAAIALRPGAFIAAADVGKAAAGVVPNVDFVASGTVSSDQRDCTRAGTAGTA